MSIGTLVGQLDEMHAVAGLMVGLLVGLTGVGGGSLMTPLLVLMFGVNPQTAVGTDLLFAAGTKTVGSAVHGFRATVSWSIVGLLAAGSIPASVLSLMVLSQMSHPPASAQNIMLLVVAVMLVFTSITVLFQQKLIDYATSRGNSGAPGRSTALFTILLGAVLGAAVTFSSVGAGAIGVTILILLYPGQPVARIVGTDIAHAVPLTLVSGVGHWIIGDVNGLLLVNLLVGSIPGVIVGSLVSSRAPDKVLRPILALVLAVSAWQLATKVLTPHKKAKAPAEVSAPAEPASR
ncbi:sulfite exporter TauE/SafE family protein [Novosphingobium rosa]|uniref:sulfite exporter TauE/SafE family protein n=1 Tax=Novosphingobium rosa TaxID=76978 RepID=UPI000ABA6D41|nr:sulfite exporter TauE/SafE family protein [Novosphingobium rosa]